MTLTGGNGLNAVKNGDATGELKCKNQSKLLYNYNLGERPSNNSQHSNSSNQSNKDMKE